MYDFSVEEGESFSLHCSVQNPESLVNIENGSLELTKNGNKLPGNSCTICFLNIMHSYIYFIATVIVCFNSWAFEDMISAHGIHLYFSCFRHWTLYNMVQWSCQNGRCRFIHMFTHDVSGPSFCFCICYCHGTRLDIIFFQTDVR